MQRRPFLFLRNIYGICPARGRKNGEGGPSRWSELDPGGLAVALSDLHRPRTEGYRSSGGRSMGRDQTLPVPASPRCNEPDDSVGQLPAAPEAGPSRAIRRRRRAECDLWCVGHCCVPFGSRYRRTLHLRGRRCGDDTTHSRDEAPHFPVRPNCSVYVHPPPRTHAQRNSVGRRTSWTCRF